MIKVDFDPKNDIPGSVLLSPPDFTDFAQWAIKLRDGTDPLSPSLRNGLTPATRQQLQQYDVAQPFPDVLRDALIDEINKLLEGLPLYNKKDFRGTAWRKERTVLMKALIKHVEGLSDDDLKKAEGIQNFNRLLVEEIYPDDIAKSANAEWGAWTMLAKAAQAAVIADWEQFKKDRANWKKSPQGTAPVFKAKLDDDIWKGFRDWLKLHVFHNKCAYCESRIVGFPGDTEHFRPKNRVRIVEDDDSSIVKVIDEEGEEIEHPGYFWLAYHWQNLLPSCQFCNAAGGKLDLFPVEKKHVAVRKLTVKEIDEGLLDKITPSQVDPSVFYLEPQDLDRLEGRLLIHPYYDNPAEHLFFNVSGEAEVWDNSAKGEWSRKVYNLDEASKLNARRDEQAIARGRYMALMGTTDDEINELKRAAKKFMDDYFSGPYPYAAAVFDFIHDRLEKTRYDPEALLGERRKKK